MSLNEFFKYQMKMLVVVSLALSSACCVPPLFILAALLFSFCSDERMEIDKEVEVLEFWRSMHLLKLLSGICLSVPMTVFASDALIYAAVYECNADEVNRTLVQACSDIYPVLTVDASDALFKWRGRNSVKAQLAKDTCEAELRVTEKSPAQVEVEVVRKQISDIKSVMRMDFLARLRTGGKDVCIEALHELAEGEESVDFR